MCHGLEARIEAYEAGISVYVFAMTGSWEFINRSLPCECTMIAVVARPCIRVSSLVDKNETLPVPEASESRLHSSCKKLMLLQELIYMRSMPGTTSANKLLLGFSHKEP